MPAPFSMSALERAEVCSPSTALPQRREVYEHALAVRGNVIHDFLKDVRDLGLVPALARAPEQWRERLAAIEVDRLPACEPEKFQAEIELAYNPVEDRALVMVRNADGKFEWDGDRSKLGPEWIPGRPDVFAVLTDRVVVLDYKSGWKRFGNVARVRQLLGYAVALARFFGKALATVGIIRIREDGSSWYDQADLSAIDLDLAALKIRSTFERAQAAGQDLTAVVEGEHCRYCPAFESCDAKQKLLREAAKALTDEQIDAMVASDPAKAVRWIQRARQLADHVEERAGELAREIGGIDLGDGTSFGPRPYAVTRIVVEKALPVLAERFGEQVARDAVKPVITQGSLKDALQTYKKRTPGTKIGQLHDNAMDALREAGAAPRSVTYPVGIYEPEKVAELVAGLALPSAAPLKPLPPAPKPLPVEAPPPTIEIPH